MPNFNKDFGGLDKDGLVTWQTFLNGELTLLRDYYASLYPLNPPLFTDADLGGIQANTLAAVNLIQNGKTDEAMSRYANPVTAKIRFGFTTAGYTTTALIKTFWDAMPKPTLYYNDQPISVTNVDPTGPEANQLVTDVTHLLANTTTGYATQAGILRDLNDVQLVAMLRDMFRVGVGTLYENQAVQKALKTAVYKMFPRRDNQGNQATIESLSFASIDGLTVPQQATLFAEMGMADFYAANGSNRDATIYALEALAQDFVNNQSLIEKTMLTWLNQPTTVPGMTDLIYVNNAARLLSYRALAKSQPIQGPTGTLDVLQILPQQLPPQEVAQGMQRQVFNAIPTGTRDQVLLDKVLNTVYPVTPAVASQFPGKTASTDFNTLHAIQASTRRARDPNAKAEEDKVALAAAQKRQDDLLQTVQARKQTIAAVVPFVTTPGAATQSHISSTITGSVNSVDQWVANQPGLSYFQGAIHMATATLGQQTSSFTGAAMQNVDTFYTQLPNKVIEGVLSGQGLKPAQELWESTIAKPVTEVVNNVINTVGPIAKTVGDFITNTLFPPLKVPEPTSPLGPTSFLSDPKAPGLFLPLAAKPLRSASEITKLQFSESLRDFLGIVNGQITGIQEAGKRGEKTHTYPYLNDDYFNNDTALGSLGKPKITLTPRAVTGGSAPKDPLFNFELLPAIKPNLPLNRQGGDGQDMPFNPQGIRYRHVQNLATLEVPGGAPIFQSLGIQGEIIEFCGVLLSYGFRSEPGKEFSLGQFPYGITGDKGTVDPTLIETERTNTHAYRAYDKSENELAALVRAGLPCQFEITYNLSKDTGQSKTLKAISHTVLLHHIERIQQRRDKVYYKLVMQRIDFGTQSAVSVGAAAKTAADQAFKKQQVAMSNAANAANAAAQTTTSGSPFDSFAGARKTIAGANPLSGIPLSPAAIEVGRKTGLLAATEEGAALQELTARVRGVDTRFHSSLAAIDSTAKPIILPGGNTASVTPKTPPTTAAAVAQPAPATSAPAQPVTKQTTPTANATPLPVPSPASPPSTTVPTPVITPNATPAPAPSTTSNIIPAASESATPKAPIVQASPTPLPTVTNLFQVVLISRRNGEFMLDDELDSVEDAITGILGGPWKLANRSAGNLTGSTSRKIPDNFEATLRGMYPNYTITVGRS